MKSMISALAIEYLELVIKRKVWKSKSHVLWPSYLVLKANLYHTLVVSLVEPELCAYMYCHLANSLCNCNGKQ